MSIALVCSFANSKSSIKPYISPETLILQATRHGQSGQHVRQPAAVVVYSRDQGNAQDCPQEPVMARTPRKESATLLNALVCMHVALVDFYSKVLRPMTVISSKLRYT